MNKYSSLSEIARIGEKLYEDKIKVLVEPINNGDFLAIEIESAEYLLGKTAEEVLLKAKEKFPNKIFHLMRVGYPGAFTHSRVSQRQHSYDGII